MDQPDRFYAGRIQQRGVGPLRQAKAAACSRLKSASSRDVVRRLMTASSSRAGHAGGGTTDLRRGANDIIYAASLPVDPPPMENQTKRC